LPFIFEVPSNKPFFSIIIDFITISPFTFPPSKISNSSQSILPSISPFTITFFAIILPFILPLTPIEIKLLLLMSPSIKPSICSLVAISIFPFIFALFEMIVLEVSVFVGLSFEVKIAIGPSFLYS